MSELFPASNSAIVGMSHRDETLSATPAGGLSTYAAPIPQGGQGLTPLQTGSQSSQVVSSITSGTADYWTNDAQISAAAQAIFANSTSQNQPDLAMSSTSTQSIVAVMATNQATIDSSAFTWPSLAIPTHPVFTGTTSSVVSQINQYMFENILQRAPTASEQNQYSSEILAHPLGNLIYDYSYAMSDVAHLQETTNDLQSAFNNDLGSSATSDIISSGEAYLYQGVTFTTLISAITSSSAESNAINANWRGVLGRSPDSSTIADYENALRNGATLASQRSDLAHSQEAANDINAIYQQVLGRSVDSPSLPSIENDLSGSQTLAGERSSVAHSAEAASDINTIYQQVLGRSVDSPSLPSIENDLSGSQTLAG
ncbi:MAG: hypothetical protein ACRYFY_06790 [Janthinobacterium lividum]